MALSVKYLPNRCNDLSSSSQDQYKKLGLGTWECNSFCREEETGDSFRFKENVQHQGLLSLCLAIHAYVHQHTHVCTHKNIYRYHTCTHTYTYTYMYMHTHAHTQWVSFPHKHHSNQFPMSFFGG